MRKRLQALLFAFGIAGAAAAVAVPPEARNGNGDAHPGGAAITAEPADTTRPTEANLAALPSTSSHPVLHRVGERASEIVLTAMHFIGVHYRRGGESIAAGFDCSGFTRYIFEETLGVVLPRRADQQAHAAVLVAVPRNQLQPGDLVFFNTLRRTFSHVGIYIGNNRFIHAPRPGGAVRTEDMSYAYWRRRYDGARRAQAAAEPTSQAPDEPGVAGVGSGATGG